MATTDVIINQALLAIGEDPESLTDPQRMTREDVLLWIDIFYRNHIGVRLNNLTWITYDDSDADHTLTAGVAPLPSDFLRPAYVYDGDAATNDPLTQITDIRLRVSDDDPTSQFMISNITELAVFGVTPTNTIKMYYYKKPGALTDDPASSPSALKEEFHLEPFIQVIQKIYEARKRKYNNAINLELWMADVLDRIKEAHGAEIIGDRAIEDKVAW